LLDHGRFSRYIGSMTRQSRTFGTWTSKISAEMAAGKTLRFGGVCVDDRYLYWSEGRPEEGGRCAIMRAGPDRKLEEVLGAPWSARSRVHEYGGGEFTVRRGRTWFVEAGSQDLYSIDPGHDPVRLTDAPDMRFADIVVDERKTRLICVAERHAPHSASEHAYPDNLIVSVSFGGKGPSEPRALMEGHDFYAAPCLSPDGRSLAFLAWDLPFMPWDAAALYVASLGDDGSVRDFEKIAGGPGNAVFQPQWNDDGKLLFVADRDGWGNLHEWSGGAIRVIAVRDADLMRPLWVFGMRSYALRDDRRIVACYLEDGSPVLEATDPVSGKSEKVETDFRNVESIVAYEDGVAFIRTTDIAAPALSVVSLNSAGTTTVRTSGADTPDVSGTSRAQHLHIGADPAKAFHALYYPPASADFQSPEGELPPVIITVHGGPTGQSDRGFAIKTQFWTSRGFGVCDVDYSGSTGYGRDFRQRLDGNWGVRDVEDVVAAARYLAGAGLADPSRVIISGSSAGGYTVLLAIANSNLFAAGACSYAVCDLAQLQRITHKFEAGYLYGLTGTTEADSEAVFSERSPLNQADKIDVPVIFFQGLDDHVVPPEQTRSMTASLEARGVPVASYEFENEGHGFRQGKTVSDVLNLQYAFYCNVLGLEPDEPPMPVSIENWPR
jgi:dipeptidyl aminopeptidase/acylaminoacyl peptidase